MTFRHLKETAWGPAGMEFWFQSELWLAGIAGCISYMWRNMVLNKNMKVFCAHYVLPRTTDNSHQTVHFWNM